MAKIEGLRSIVILRALQLGDLLCTVPAFRALRHAHPTARITLIGLPWAKEFARRFSAYLDDFIEFPGWPGLPEVEPQIALISAFLEEARGRKFDLALQMQGSGGITNPLITLLGAKQTAGFYLPGQYCPSEKTFAVYPEGEHEVRVYLRLMAFFGIKPQGEHLEFPITQEEKETFQRFCASYHLEPGQYICLHPGARFIGRRWSTENFAAVGDALAKMGYRVVLTGAKSESALTKEVASQMREPALDLAGKTDLATLAQVIQHTRLLICNDTGVSHIAVAMKTPSVILFTVEDQRWRPLNHDLHRAVSNAQAAGVDAVLSEAQPFLQPMEAYVQQ